MIEYYLKFDGFRISNVHGLIERLSIAKARANIFTTAQCKVQYFSPSGTRYLLAQQI